VDKAEELSAEDIALCVRVRKRCQDWLDTHPEPQPPSWWDSFRWGVQSILTLGLHDKEPPMTPLEPPDIVVYRAHCKVTLEMVNDLLEKGL